VSAGEIRVVRGAPDDDELAALLVVLHILAARAEPVSAQPGLDRPNWLTRYTMPSPSWRV
jgi:hypothetical protein